MELTSAQLELLRDALALASDMFGEQACEIEGKKGRTPEAMKLREKESQVRELLNYANHGYKDLMPLEVPGFTWK